MLRLERNIFIVTTGLALSALTGCLTPTFRGTKVLAPGAWEVNGGLTIFPAWQDFPGLSLSTGIRRGLGKDLDVGLQAAYILGDFGGADYRSTLTFLTRKQRTTRSMSHFSLGYLGAPFSQAYERSNSGFAELAISWSSRERRFIFLGKEFSPVFYWGVGGGIYVGEVGEYFFPFLLYPLAFLGYEGRHLVIELEGESLGGLGVGVRIPFGKRCQ